MMAVLQAGGLGAGGFNFDAKLRRESTDPEDIFYAHISGMDTLARGLRNAAELIDSGHLQARATRFVAITAGPVFFPLG